MPMGKGLPTNEGAKQRHPPLKKALFSRYWLFQRENGCK